MEFLLSEGIRQESLPSTVPEILLEDKMTQNVPTAYIENIASASAHTDAVDVTLHK